MISFYKSIIDQDRASIVICNLKHEIIYMNPAAVNSYAKRGGDKLIGRSPASDIFAVRQHACRYLPCPSHSAELS